MWCKQEGENILIKPILKKPWAKIPAVHRAIIILLSVIFAAASYGIYDWMAKAGYELWHEIIAISFLWILYAIVIHGVLEVFTKEGGHYIIKVTFFVISAAGMAWIYNDMTKGGAVWWQLIIAISSLWLLYVLSVWVFIPWIEQRVEENPPTL